jgi:hypothetical protein
MRTKALGRALGIVVCWLVAAPPPVHADERGPAPNRGASPFALYCASCHGFDARGVTGREPRASGPDLTHLVSGSPDREGPYTLTPLVEFVTSPRRPGPQRICGERVFARLPTSRFREHLERWVVRAALEDVEKLARQAHAEATPAREAAEATPPAAP